MIGFITIWMDVSVCVWWILAFIVYPLFYFALELSRPRKEDSFTSTSLPIHHWKYFTKCRYHHTLNDHLPFSQSIPMSWYHWNAVIICLSMPSIHNQYCLLPTMTSPVPLLSCTMPWPPECHCQVVSYHDLLSATAKLYHTMTSPVPLPSCTIWWPSRCHCQVVPYDDLPSATAKLYHTMTSPVPLPSCTIPWPPQCHSQVVPYYDFSPVPLPSCTIRWPSRCHCQVVQYDDLPSATAKLYHTMTFPVSLPSCTIPWPPQCHSQVVPYDDLPSAIAKLYHTMTFPVSLPSCMIL